MSDPADHPLPGPALGALGTGSDLLAAAGRSGGRGPLWAAAASATSQWLALLALATLLAGLDGVTAPGRNLLVATGLACLLLPELALGGRVRRLADRSEVRLVTVAAELGRAALLISIPLVDVTAWVFVAAVLVGLLGPVARPGHRRAVLAGTPRRHRAEVRRLELLARYGTALPAAVLAAVLGGLSGLFGAGRSPATGALFAAAVLALAAVVPLARPGPDHGGPGHAGPGHAWPVGRPVPSLLERIRSGRDLAGGYPALRPLAAVTVAALLGPALVVGLGPVQAADLGVAGTGYAWLVAATVAGLGFGFWLGPATLSGFSERRRLVLAVTALGLGSLLLPLTADTPLACALALVLGWGAAVAWRSGAALVVRTVPAEAAPRALAALAALTRVVSVLVAVLAPALAAAVGRLRPVPPVGAQEPVVPTPTGMAPLLLPRPPAGGAAWVLLAVGVLAVAGAVVAARRLDDRDGASWLADLRRSLRPLSGVGDLTPRPRPGFFIAFEGGEGGGKSTQARLLADWLAEQGHRVVATREPGGTPLGQRLRETLLETGTQIPPRAEALLFAADRADHVATVVGPALAAGSVVVTDRFVDSSIAYQAAGRAMSEPEIAALSRWATQELVPDLTVLLDLDPELSRRRLGADPSRGGRSDRLESLPEDFHRRVRARFLGLARRSPERYLVLDAASPVAELQQVIRDRVRELLPISELERARLEGLLDAEETVRERQAAAEAEVMRLDAELRGRSAEEFRAREEEARRARREAEAQLQAEAERQLRADELRLPSIGGAAVGEVPGSASGPSSGGAGGPGEAPTERFDLPRSQPPPTVPLDPPAPEPQPPVRGDNPLADDLFRSGDWLQAPPPEPRERRRFPRRWSDE